MALTDFQREVVLIAMGVAAPRGFAVGGGLGLQLHGFGDRPTDDLDSYTAAFEIEVFDDTVEALRAALPAARPPPCSSVTASTKTPLADRLETYAEELETDLEHRPLSPDDAWISPQGTASKSAPLPWRRSSTSWLIVEKLWPYRCGFSLIWPKKRVGARSTTSGSGLTTGRLGPGSRPESSGWTCWPGSGTTSSVASAWRAQM